MKKLSILALLFLTGCGAFPGNPQGYSGITQGKASFNDEGKITDVSIVSGREQETVTFSANLNEGTFDYTASGTRAFLGQAQRAELEAKISEDFSEILPETISQIVDRVLGAL